MNRKLINMIKSKFAERMQAKTGWGRNEVIEALNAAISDALLELLEEDKPC